MKLMIKFQNCLKFKALVKPWLALDQVLQDWVLFFFVMGNASQSSTTTIYYEDSEESPNSLKTVGGIMLGTGITSGLVGLVIWAVSSSDITELRTLQDTFSLTFHEGDLKAAISFSF